MARVQIEDLTPIGLPAVEYMIPVQRDGVSGSMSVGQLLSIVIGDAGSALDTLGELADALNDDEHFAATVITALAGKADLTKFNALFASNIGSSRPAGAVAGTGWLRNSVGGQLSYYIYDGSVDRLIYTIITATGEIRMPRKKSPMGHCFGLSVTKSSADGDPGNDIGVAAGECTSDSGYQILIAAATMKKIDAPWAAGSGVGGLDTGSVGNGVYYIWAIQRSDTGAADILLSLSATAPTMPANYDLKMLIGRLTRAAGVNGVPGLVIGNKPTVGSNTDGSYEMFPDGTLRCASAGVSAAVTSADGSLFRSSPSNWNFPVPFDVAPEGVVNIASTSRWPSVATTTTAMAYRQYAAVSDAAVAATILNARGRWYP
jgi:hypothetical protein